jgi:hypothetical protein
VITTTVISFLSRLNKREKLVFYCTAGVVALVLLDRIIVGPIFSKIRLLDERIKIERELIRKNARIVAEKDRIAHAVQAVSAYSRTAKTQEEEIAFLLGEVEKLARKASLYIGDMKPMGVQEDAVSRKYSVDLNCEAQMDQVVNFMYDIENAPMLFLVESFNVSPKSKDSSIAKVNMRISNVIFL